MIAGHTSTNARCRVQTGGDQTLIHSVARYHAKAVSDQHDAEGRQDREADLVGPLADPRDQVRARLRAA